MAEHSPWLLASFLWSSLSTAALALDLSHYQSHAEINRFLIQLAEEHPGQTTLHALGTSRMGRDILALEVASNPDTTTNVYINGAHHGDEKASAAATIGLLKDLLQRNTPHPHQALLRDFRLVIQPIVNPDGYSNHSRYDSFGIDPNRDYAFPDRLPGDSFLSPEINLIRNLMEQIPFAGAISMHSGMEGILWPWCYSAAPNPHADTFRYLAEKAAAAMGLDYAVQSHWDYKSKGEFIDFAYMNYRTLALTFEIATERSPSQANLPEVIKRTIKGTFAYLGALRKVLYSNRS